MEGGREEENEGKMGKLEEWGERVWERREKEGWMGKGRKDGIEEKMAWPHYCASI